MKKVNLIFATTIFVVVCIGMSSCKDNVGTPNSYSKSGLYLGVTGFNGELYSYKHNSKNFRLLNSESRFDFTRFVGGLELMNGTLLYYTVDNVIRLMDKSHFPDDLTKVAIVTFTDGIDQGSGFKNSKYESVSAVSESLKSARVDGLPIEAYTIGLKGGDVQDQERFESDLRALSSSSENAMLVSNMNEVESKFQEIAKSLYSETSTTLITITCPGQNNEQKVRFTFDGGLSNADDSKCYIEGIWNNKKRVISDIITEGMECSNGESIKFDNVGGIDCSFVLENVIRTEGKGDFVKSKIQMWLKSSDGKWQKNSEFSPEDSEDPIIEQKSAAIMLVIDCSSSLKESGLKQLKEAANNFIITLSRSVKNEE